MIQKCEQYYRDVEMLWCKPFYNTRYRFKKKKVEENKKKKKNTIQPIYIISKGVQFEHT